MCLLLCRSLLSSRLGLNSYAEWFMLNVSSDFITKHLLRVNYLINLLISCFADAIRSAVPGIPRLHLCQMFMVFWLRLSHVGFLVNRFCAICLWSSVLQAVKRGQLGQEVDCE
jgi:hypothetical protein